MQSIVSYLQRGNYGSARWRGNCSGYLIKDLLEHYRPQVFADPMCGSDTAGDVVRELNLEGWNLEYFGFDLKDGFNILSDSLTERMGGRQADYIFTHPPYGSMIRYSGEVWGAAHPDDLSRCESYPEFLVKMRVALQNVYEALKPHANYSILIGDWRSGGAYRSIQADLIQLAPGILDGVMIKTQHNCQSDRRRYPGGLIKIAHEFILNFRKDKLVVGILETTLAISRRIRVLARANWQAIIRKVLGDLGGQASLREIYAAIERDAPETVKPRANWKARVRAELQENFTSIERGVWARAA